MSGLEWSRHAKDGSEWLYVRDKLLLLVASNENRDEDSPGDHKLDVSGVLYLSVMVENVLMCGGQQAAVILVWWWLMGDRKQTGGNVHAARITSPKHHLYAQVAFEIK